MNGVGDGRLKRSGSENRSKTDPKGLTVADSFCRLSSLNSVYMRVPEEYSAAVRLDRNKIQDLVDSDIDLKQLFDKLFGITLRPTGEIPKCLITKGLTNAQTKKLACRRSSKYRSISTFAMIDAYKAISLSHPSETTRCI